MYFHYSPVVSLERSLGGLVMPRKSLWSITGLLEFGYCYFSTLATMNVSCRRHANARILTPFFPRYVLKKFFSCPPSKMEFLAARAKKV